MATTMVWPETGGERAVRDFEEKIAARDGGEVVLDFSAVRRVDASALKAVERVAGLAGEKGVKVAIRGVNVDVYKVLKLMKLTSKFRFEN